MKTSLFQSNRRRSEHGSATIVVLVMLGIMMIFFATNLVTIKTLTRELKLVEKKQVERLSGGVPHNSGGVE
ncbi:MAG TPA: hypothetical protein VH598_16320 [Verrucomicrobiae bacterium]|nr:hypothetical protein [Verrucomicrobiae bacterium]